ncbi:MAG: hydroxyphenylacetyl-CoA thioesterase PaaI [Rhodospirillales bacterium]
MTPDELAQACADAMWAEDHASRGLGMTLEYIAPGRSRLSMVVAQSMVNGLGVCHGGFILTLADSAMAFASNAHGDKALAQHIAVTYVRPARLGENLVAEAEERLRTGRTGMYDVRVTGDDGSAVAEMRGHTRLSGGKFFPEA